MYCKTCGKEVNQLLSICDQTVQCIDCCKRYLDKLKKEEYRPQGTSVWIEGKPAIYYNKQNNLKACYIKKLPEQVETVVFVGESFGFYNTELTKETLDNMKDFNTTIDWSSDITQSSGEGSTVIMEFL